MDTETINETGHIIISVIVSILLITVLTGATFLEKMNDLVGKTVPEYEKYSYQSDSALTDYIHGTQE